MKEASAAVGSGTSRVRGNHLSWDRSGRAGFVTNSISRHEIAPMVGAQSNLTGNNWVIRGTVSCPDCEPVEGEDKYGWSILEKKVIMEIWHAENECRKVLNMYRSALIEKAKM